MSDTTTDHERRISTIEGEMKSVATKADLEAIKADIAELKHDLNQSFHVAIRAATKEQTDELKQVLDRQSEQIRELQDNRSRLGGIGDTLRIVAPFVVSIVAVVVALASR